MSADLKKSRISSAVAAARIEDQIRIDTLSDIPGAKFLNIIEGDISRGSDLIGLIHSEFDRQQQICSRSWKGRVLHIRSKENYEMDGKALRSSIILQWEEMKYENLLGVLQMFSTTSPKKLDYTKFRRLVDTGDVNLPKSVETLDDLWLPAPKTLLNKLDLQLAILDNRVALEDFDNPLTHLCKTNNIFLAGIQESCILLGGPRTFSPSHHEVKHFGSINKMMKGLSLWFIIHYDDNAMLIRKLKQHLGVNCDALLESKVYVILPSLLRKWGIRFYLILQKPGDIVVTFPGAIHTVYNLKFTVKNALNFLPTRWINPILNHVDCFCPTVRETSGDMENARLLEHGQSLAMVVANSLILESIEAWKALRYQNGGSFIGLLDPMTNRLPLLPKKRKMLRARDFGTDRKSYDAANKSDRKYYCRVCVEDKMITEEEALMKRSTFNRHVAECHVKSQSTKFCTKCVQRFGDRTSLHRHKC